jgi:hypothetical protein
MITVSLYEEANYMKWQIYVAVFAFIIEKENNEQRSV